jgi:uncharacterized protein (TIGR03083 family)
MSDAMKVLQALSSSQQRLGALVSGLEPADLERDTSDDGWTVAEVLAHLGSQSEIFTLFVDAGLSGTEPPSNEAFGPIWDAWNAKSPEGKASDALKADATFLEHVESLDADHLARFELSLFGMDVDAARLLGMRLGELTLHSWDIEVVFDEEAVLAPDATELLVDGLGTLVSRVGKPEDQPRSIGIITSLPERRYVLDTGAVSLEPGEAADGSPRLELSSEALIRLVYGRLDDHHLGVPAPEASNVDLDSLRAIFPGV